VLFDALADHGARAVFGIPGDFAIPLFTALRTSSQLPLFTLAHEPSAAFAADAAARFAGGLGVALFTFGAGTLNAINPIANAYAEHVPLVVISGAPSAAERGRGLLVHHQVHDFDSQRRILSEITVDHAVLDDPATAPALIARVLAACRDESRPVYFEVPRDVVMLPAQPVRPIAPREAAPDLLKTAVGLLLDRVRHARRGVILVDAGVRRFGVEASVTNIADALGWPVATTFMGRGVLSGPRGRAPSWLGGASDEAITAALKTADLIVGIGLVHSDTNYAGGPGFHTDVRYVDLSHRAVCIVQDSVYDLPLGAFVAALENRIGVTDVGLRASRPERPNAFEVSIQTQFTRDDAPLQPDDIAHATNEAFYRNGAALPVVSDVGDCLFAAEGIAFDDFLASGYYATMGFAIPGAMGVQAVSGKRPLVLVGDGAFQMTGLELGRCTEAGLDPIVIVFDNARWQMVASFDKGGASHNLPPVDFAAIARALGGEAYTASNRQELGEALDAAFARRGVFQLIHARLASGAVSTGMRRFVEAFAKGRQDVASGPR